MVSSSRSTSCAAWLSSQVRLYGRRGQRLLAVHDQDGIGDHRHRQESQQEGEQQPLDIGEPAEPGSQYLPHRSVVRSSAALASAYFTTMRATCHTERL